MDDALWWPDGGGPRPVRPPRPRRAPDEVRRACVRAVLAFAVTLIALMVTFFASFADAWFFLPSVVATAVGVFVTTWCVLDIWVARQIAAQRYWGSGTDTAWANSAAQGRRPRRAHSSG